MKQYEQEAPLTTGLHNLSEGDYLHSVRAGLVVPLLQSVTIGVLVTIIASVILEYNDITDWLRWSSLMGLVAVLMFFLNGLRLWRHLVRLVERELQVDLTPNDGVDIPPKVVYVDMPGGSAEYPAVTRHELPFADRLPTFAAGIKQGKPLTHAVWVSGKSTDKLFSSGEFSTLTEIMLENKWIELVNQRDVTRGYKMTRAGMAVMRSLATTHPLGDDLSDGWVRR